MQHTSSLGWFWQNIPKLSTSLTRQVLQCCREPEDEEEAELRDLEEEGSMVQGGYDVPGMTSGIGRNRRGTDPIDEDEDVVAQQRCLPSASLFGGKSLLLYAPSKVLEPH